ncbi:MAG TPA: hypothetical protein VGF61_07755 [Candidatus Acidoferrum sp.]|jgi:hypothetical protein
MGACCSSHPNSVFRFALFLLLAPSLTSAQVPKSAAQEKPASPGPKLLAPPDQYRPITGGQRMRWIACSTLGPESLLAGIWSAGIGTARDSPPEYGPHWGGFGDRYGMRLTGISTSNVMEAGFGAIWGEDPRYFRAAGQPFGRRIEHIFVMTVVAPRRDGHYALAYARLIAYPGNNFLSNTWRVSSDSTTTKALERTGYAFSGKIVLNAWTEFWPDVRKAVFKK